MKVREGKVEIETGEAFFNPYARPSRDVSVLVLRVLSPKEVADVMCASGIRGIRYAVEAGVEHVVFNDVDEKALETARRNVRAYGIDAEFHNEDANVLLHTHRFEAVDIDPFGPPTPFLHSASRAGRMLLLVTATDTSPLVGRSPRAAKRKYHAVVKRVEWWKEYALRVLLGYVYHSLALWEKGLEPVASMFLHHHVRVIVRVTRSPNRYARFLNITEGGPLWTGPLHDKEVMRRALSFWDEDYSNEARRHLEIASEEEDIVGYHDLHSLSLSRVPPLGEVITLLREHGYRASRTVFSPTAVKTDADRETLLSLLEELV